MRTTKELYCETAQARVVITRQTHFLSGEVGGDWVDMPQHDYGCSREKTCKHYGSSRCPVVRLNRRG